MSKCVAASSVETSLTAHLQEYYNYVMAAAAYNQLYTGYQDLSGSPPQPVCTHP